MLGECDLIASKKVTMTLKIYDGCLKDEFKAYYEKYFNNLIAEMT